MDERHPSALRLSLAVGCGAGIGSLLRYLTDALLGGLYATAFVNILGSAAIMLFATSCGRGGRFPLGVIGRQFIMGGLCGGFTTFSAMSLDAFILLVEGNVAVATTYIVTVIGLSLVAAWIGHLVGQRLVSRSTGD
jgi:CrcB protein